MRRQLLVTAAAALLSACAGQEARPAAKADPPYVFPHSPHLDGDVDCKACHGAIARATRLEDRVRHVALPVKNSDTCDGCHDDKDFKEKVKLVVPARTRAFDLRFDHAAHLARPGVTCVRCHAAPPEAGQTAPARPPMSACTGCHNHQADFKAGRCAPCHVDLKRFPKPVAAFQHAGDFLRLHGAQARPTAESCAACHDQTFCADCHSATTAPGRQAVLFPEAVQRDFIHRGDYQSRHMVEAEASPASCRRCHGSAFCDSCHTPRNLTQSSALQPLNPHPTGWVSDRAGGNFHGHAARKNIVACAACHDAGAAAVCVRCHAVGRIDPATGQPMPSPHPSSWNRKASEIGKTAVCAACHH